MAGRNNDAWADERVERLKALLANGLSSSEIGAQLGVSRNAVIGKVNRLGLASNRPARLPCDRTVRRQRAKTASGASYVSVSSTRVYARRPAKALPAFACDEPHAMPQAGTKPGAGAAVSLNDLGENDCTAVISADGDPAVMYCGQTRGRDWQGRPSPYCPMHHALFCVPVKQRRART